MMGFSGAGPARTRIYLRYTAVFSPPPAGEESPSASLGGQEIAIQAAKNFWALRNLGVTVRKTIDKVIATRCIESGYDLLHNDRDFDPFSKHLGLRAAAA